MVKRTRLGLVLGAIVLAGGLLGGLWYAGHIPVADETRPAAVPSLLRPRHIVLITLDTTRADHLGAYGYEHIRTPTIDALAHGGVLFRRAIAPAPITLPSHSSIMTGLYPPSHGVRDNGTFVLSDEMTTLAEVLKSAGYTTGAFVGAAVLARRYGLTQGFDVYDDDFSRGRRRMQFMYAERPCEQVVDVALAWVEQQRAARTFTWLHFYDPHANYDPPESWAAEYHERPYDGEIAYSDHCLQTFFNALKGWGMWTDTLVLLTADHGESLGEHGEKTHGLFIYEATVHVPLIVYGPSFLPAGRVENSVVSTVDIFPTLLALLDLETPRRLDGVSLLPGRRGQQEQAERAVYSEALLPKHNYGWAELKGMTSQAWKMIEAPKPELYDLDRDPRELVNVYTRYPRPVRHLRQALAEVGRKPAAVAPRLQVDAETARQLRALGYVAGGETVTVQGTPPDPKDMIHTHLHVQQGRAFIRQERFDEAAAEFHKVLVANPNSLQTYLDLAAVYLAQGKPELARQPLAQALALTPNNPRVYNMMGVVENRLGQREEALHLFRRAIAHDPTFEGAYVNIAVLWERAGELDKAEEAVRTALKHTPTSTSALTRLGSILLARGDQSGAAAALHAALKTDPYHAPAHRNLGVLYDQQGRYDDALREYQEALKSDAQMAEAHHAIGVIYTKQGKLEQAEVQLKEALRINPKLDEAFISLGIVYDQQGLWEQALAASARATELNPNAYQAFGNMAVVYLQRGEYDQAEAVLTRALDLKSDYPEGYNNLAVLYMKRDELEKAFDAAQKALQYRPDYPEALTNLGSLYHQQGQFEQAATHYQDALAINPAYWQARHNLALTLLQLRRYDAAEAALVEVLRVQPNLAAAHKYLGDLYFTHLRVADKARKHYRIYLQLDSQGQERQEVEARLRQLESS